MFFSREEARGKARHEPARSLPGRGALMTPSSRVTMARTAALFFLSGALIVPIALATPHERARWTSGCSRAPARPPLTAVA